MFHTCTSTWFRWEAQPFLYGVLLASYSAMSFVFTPIVARLSDRYGRRKILLTALAVSSLAYFLFGSAQAIWLLFLGRMLSGTTAATVPVAQAYVADVTTPNQRLKYLGLLGAAAGVAFILGPAIGGTLSSLFGYGLTVFSGVCFGFYKFGFSIFSGCLNLQVSILKEQCFLSRALLAVLRKQKIALLLSIYFLFFVAFVFLQAALSPWLQKVFGFGSLETGLVFFFVGGVSVFTQAVLMPILSKKMDRTTLTLLSVGALTFGLVALAPVGNLALLFVVAALIAFGFGVQIVTLNTLISLNTPKDAQGGSLGIAWAMAGRRTNNSTCFGSNRFFFWRFNWF